MMHQQTSTDAWESMKHTMPSITDKVLAIMKEHPDGMTHEMLYPFFEGYDESASRQGIRSLVAQGVVVDSGKRVPSRKGRAVIVWIIKQGG